MLLKKPKKISVLINFRASKEEVALYRKKARKWADGNLTLFIKHALDKWEPRKKDLT